MNNYSPNDTHVTIGMSAYNLLKYSRKTIESILQSVHDYKYKLVVVDDCSTDKSQEYFESDDLKRDIIEAEQCEYYKYIRFGTNKGAPTAWNRILDESEDLAIVINNDIIPGRYWISNLVQYMKEHPEVGVGSSHVIDPPVFDMENNEYKWYDYTEELAKREWDVADDGLHGCCIAVTKECRNTIGQFDTQFERTSYEDCDYVVRAQREGFLVKTTHRSIIYHYGGITQHYMTVNEGGNGYQQRNRRRFEQKWGIDLGGSICSRAMFWNRKPDGTNERIPI